ncbi:MAG TPA: metal-sulfur cluster assembly factor [Candidatus Dormibacteraeota bacterium]|nr:metal-sulfur cluster assembly factor [Candidatus Dormibacteraeota bacterium]HVC23641.1 metal-sulfur cluster assembly factor [Candidatus Dormibacteraeota bacterium]
MAEPTQTETAEAAGPQAQPAVGPMATGEDVHEALREVIDPELGLDIVSLGLVYHVTVDKDGDAVVAMTLTTPYCPMGPMIESQVHAVTQFLPGINDVKVDLVWDPPWDPHTMASDEAKLELGLY